MKKLSKRFALFILIVLVLMFFFVLADRSCKVQKNTEEKTPETVAVLMPSIQEMLCYVGGQRFIVATSDHSVFPKNIQNLPKVAGFKGIDYESLTRISPDAVFSNKVHDSEKDKIEQLGIKYYSFDDTSINNIRESMKRMTDILSIDDQNKKIKNFFRAQNDLENGQTAIIVVGSSDELKNIYISGKGNIFSELLDMAGYENAYKGELEYPSVGAEELLRMNPDVIFILDERNKIDNKTREAIIDDWNKLQIDACKKNKIFILNGDHVFIPGPRIEKIFSEIKKKSGE